MKEERKKDIKLMADAIDHRKYPMTPEESYQQSTVSPDIKKKLLKADEIIATKKLEIPVCKLIPTNGRIYVIEVTSSDLKSPGGLILPQLFGMKKDDSMADVKRYFVVAWDKIGIPVDIANLLTVGIEVNPFLSEDAIGYRLPKVVDWQGNNIFYVLHYTELAGISSVQPEIVE